MLIALFFTAILIIRRLTQESHLVEWTENCPAISRGDQVEVLPRQIEVYINRM